MSTIAIVILNYNGRNYLEKFLPSVVSNSSNTKIIIADNASNDDSVEFLKKYYPSLPLILLDENHGYAGGYNLALKQVEADYFILLNSDIEVTPEWIEPLQSFMDKNPNYAACQPKILDFNKPDHFEYAGAAGGFMDALGYPFCRGRLFNVLEKDIGQYNDEIDIFWATGACMMIRSKVFLEKKGFDDDFFAHMEEIDLCWRMLNDGWKIRFIPTSKVFHVGGGTLAQSNPFKTYLNFRNALSVFLKNTPANELAWKLPLKFLLDWIAALKFLFDSGTKHALSVFKAHLYVLRNFFSILRKRRVTIKGLTKPYSIVYKHFIGKIKFYSRLSTTK